MAMLCSGRSTYVEQDGPLDTPCWIWQGSLCKDGYGKMTDGRALAHRRMYEQVRGAIAAHLEIDHLCRARACVNPEHLQPVPHKINTWRSANTKLSYEIACEVRAAFASWSGTKTAFCQEWASKLGVCSQNVYKIVSGHSWVLPEGTW